jgi:hypothetical protein
MKRLSPLVIAIVVLTIILSSMNSCKAQASTAVKDTVTVTFAGTSEYGTPMYNVKLPNGSTIEYMYAEEIAASIASGKWQYNEDLILNSKK